MKTIDIKKLKNWSKFGLTFSDELQYIHKITAISETFNLPKQTTKYFNTKLKLNISKKRTIYYKGRATSEFFEEWKNNKESLKKEGWGLIKCYGWEATTNGRAFAANGPAVQSSEKSWHIVRYLTAKI